MRQIFGMRGSVCPFRLLCISKICAAYVFAAAEQKLFVILTICLKFDAPLAPNATLYSLNTCGFLLQWCLVVVRSGCSACRPSSPFKKKKKNSAEPQREILFLAVLRMDRLCNFHATSDALSALCGYVCECVCVCV